MKVKNLLAWLCFALLGCSLAICATDDSDLPDISRYQPAIEHYLDSLPQVATSTVEVGYNTGGAYSLHSEPELFISVVASAPDTDE